MKAGWNEDTIQNVCEHFTDGNWIETKDQSPEGIRLIQTGNIGQAEFKSKLDKARFISNDTFEALGCTEVLSGDLLVSRLPDPVGRCAMVPDLDTKAITAVDCSILRLVLDRITPQFFIYYSLSQYYLREVDQACTGTTRRRISRKNLGKVLVPLPPLEEQQAIVDKLDRAFAGLETVRANAEANLENAKELFQSLANSAIDIEVPEKNEERLVLGDVARIQSGAGFPKKYQGRAEGEYPFYKVSDMNLVGNEHSLSYAVNYVDDEVRKDLGAKVFPIGSVLFPKVGGAILTNKKRVVRQAGVADNNVMGIVPNPDLVRTEFIMFWLQTQDLFEWSNKANPPSITQHAVSNLSFNPPSLDVQDQIVKTLTQALDASALLQQTYNSQLEDLDELKQSLLQKAFAGELT